MDYKVSKLNFPSEFPSFNISEESEDICKLCHIAVPKETGFVGPVCIGDIYMDLCPRCAKGIRNLMLKQPADAMFPSEETNRWYNRFISWLMQKGIE